VPPGKSNLWTRWARGDSFDSGFLHEYLQGGDLAACLAAGNLAGSFLDYAAREELKAFRDASYRRTSWKNIDCKSKARNLL